tara:strand:- start:30926 stop:32815 length:1890 start_codon:yes stop_codon:yes gene_type:complete
MMRGAYMEPRQRQVLSAIIVVAGAIAGFALWFKCGTSDSPPTSQAVATADASTISDAELRDLASWCVKQWSGETPQESLRTPAEAVYIAVRQNGLRQTQAWGDGATLGIALADAVSNLGNDADQATSLEIFVVTSSEALSDSETKRLLSNIHRGIVGIEELRDDGTLVRHSPTEVVASNRSHRKLVGIAASAEAPPDSRYRLLHGEQILVNLQNSTANRMLRGNEQVDLIAVTTASVTSFSEKLATWMWASLHDNGRMTYLYWPSLGREAPGRDNLIRQFMATIALGRSAAATNNAELWQRSAANIDYNLRTYYSQEDALGLVTLREKVKLGAVALAALAIVEHPQRGRWKEQEDSLRRTVDALWQPDGSFRTFHKPVDRNDNQNFYPGEALLLWATLISQSPESEPATPEPNSATENSATENLGRPAPAPESPTQNAEPKLLARFMKSFAYYRAWHLDESIRGRRNPAFIPWHTQAYYLVWQTTKNPELRDFIFEMNDWLLDVQQWDSARFPDTKGRFYAPDHDYGPPHASATGVYLEGLVDAYSLAVDVGDNTRAAQYSDAIRKGLRSSMQLQFADDIDMFYVSKRERVFGGLRTTVYDNQIRCDNVQHTLMATLKILESGALPAAH